MRKRYKTYALFLLISLIYCSGEKEIQGKGPQKAKKLVIGISNKASAVTPFCISGFNTWMLLLVNDKLVGPSPYTGMFENVLAEYLRPAGNDGRTWEIKLKRGITWHDGTSLTSEDVAFTINYFRDGPSNRFSHHCNSVPMLPGEGVIILDSLTLRISGENPIPNFDRVTAAELPIIQKKQWENVTEPRRFMDIPIGTGPYKVIDCKPDEYYRFAANENYFRGKPLVDELIVTVIKDPSVMFTALKSGEIDGAWMKIPPELALQWQNDSDIKIIKTPGLSGVWLYLNVARQPFIQRRMRQAICLGINPDPFLEVIMLGQGKSGTLGWPHPDAFWTKPGLYQPYNPVFSTDYLNDLNYNDVDGDGFRENPDGSALDWKLVVQSSQPLLIRAAEMVTDQLKKIGIRSHVQTLETSGFSETVSKTLDYDMAISEIVPHGIADEDMLIIIRQGERRRELIKDTEKDGLVRKWFEASTREERFKAAGELQELNNKYPSRIVLWYPREFWAYRWKSYDNYSVSPGYGIFHKWSFLPNDSRGKTILQTGNVEK